MRFKLLILPVYKLTNLLFKLSQAKLLGMLLNGSRIELRAIKTIYGSDQIFYRLLVKKYSGHAVFNGFYRPAPPISYHWPTASHGFNSGDAKILFLGVNK